MNFREELHPRDRGRFSSKPGRGASNSSGTATSDGGSGGDPHSRKVPPEIRRSERKHLLALMGEDPTPAKERQVLSSEAQRLTSKARDLLDELHGSREAEKQQQHQRGQYKHQAAEQKRQREDAARAAKGLKAKDRQKEKQRRRTHQGKAPGGAPRQEKGPRGELREVYFRLVVVRDMARSRGVRL